MLALGASERGSEGARERLRGLFPREPPTSRTHCSTGCLHLRSLAPSLAAKPQKKMHSRSTRDIRYRLMAAPVKA